MTDLKLPFVDFLCFSLGWSARGCQISQQQAMDCIAYNFKLYSGWLIKKKSLFETE